VDDPMRPATTIEDIKTAIKTGPVEPTHVPKSMRPRKPIGKVR
jgi:hypothetical protein